MPSNSFNQSTGSNVPDNAAHLVHNPSSQSYFQELLIPPSPKLTLEPELVEAIEKMGRGEKLPDYQADFIKNIPEYEGLFSSALRAELYSACFHIQNKILGEIKPREFLAEHVKHLELILDFFTPLGIEEMAEADRIGWQRLMNKHLALLSISDGWDEIKAEHLKNTAEILEIILFSDETNLELSDEKRAEIVTAIGRFLNDTPNDFFRDPLISVYPLALAKLVVIAGNMEAPELFEAMKDLFWRVERVIKDFEVANDERDRESSEEPDVEQKQDEDQAEESADGGLALYEESEVEETDFVPLEEEDSTFEDRLIDDQYEALEYWDVLQDAVMEAMLAIPNPDPCDPIWLDILRNTSSHLEYWPLALSGLALSDSSLVKEFLEETSHKAVKDPSSAESLVLFMAQRDNFTDPISNDTQAMVLDAVGKLERKKQHKIIQNLKPYVFSVEECKYVEGEQLFRENALKLAAYLGIDFPE